MITAVIYPKCSTCRNAIKWFDDHKIAYQVRHIIDEALTASELKALHKQSGLPIKRFFNTSGIKYRELGLSNKIVDMTDDECYDLLATDGMLVKRPLVYSDTGLITLGFKPVEYDFIWKESDF